MLKFSERFAVTLFSLTNELMRADRTPNQVLDQFLESGLTKLVEIDGPQHFRNYPHASDAEIQQLKEVLIKHNASVVQLGIYVDRARTPELMLTGPEVVQHLEDQLKLAAKIGAPQVRLGLGFAKIAELKAILPLAKSLGIRIVLEIQGTTEPEAAEVLEHIEFLQGPVADQIGILLDTSVCMKVLPPTYLAALSAAGFEEPTIEQMVQAWQTMPAAAVRGLVFGQIMPKAPNAEAASLALTLPTRMGKTTIDQWEHVLPFVKAVHLKFWDTSDVDGAISEPTTALLNKLADHNFAGALISEWGGHDWHKSEINSIQVLSAHRDVCLRIEK